MAPSHPPAFNIADLFELVAGSVPERLAVVCGDRRTSYRDLDERAHRLANALRGLGLAPGEHVGLLLYNRVEHIEALIACFKARLVPINLNYRYTADELAYLIDDADLAALIHELDLETTVSAARTQAGGPERTIVVAADRPASASAWYDEIILTTSLDELDRRSGNDLYILYTGGTTGMPKGVMWRQEDIFFAVLGGGNAGGPPIERPEEIAATVRSNRSQRIGPFLPTGDPGPEHFVCLGLGPLMHAGGQWSALGTLLGGGTLVLYDRPHMDMTHVLDLVERERVAALNIIGDANARPLVAALESNAGTWNTSSLRLIGSGGSMLSGDLKDRLLEALPSVEAIVEAIGSSESPAQAIAVSTRTGGPARSLTFKAKEETMLVDDDLRPIARGSRVVGRLATRGRVPLGYYKDEERSARTFVELEGQRWSLPGDMATIDADGTVRLIGRGSQCINSGGEKIYPAEVEAVLVGHAAVGDAVVVGVADPEWGQRVTAVVAPVGSDRAPTLADLQAHARTQLAGYKVPRGLIIVSEIKRSPAGKADYNWARDVARDDPSR
jgi:acyl-CoA synthetase (AMP-forming)/AMP-acid ligase II